MSKLNEKKFIEMANKIYIEPTNEVLEFLKKEFDQINKNLEKLEKIDTSNTEPLVRLAKPIFFLREDEKNEKMKLDKKIALNNASEKNDNYIIIKRILK